MRCDFGAAARPHCEPAAYLGIILTVQALAQFNAGSSKGARMYPADAGTYLLLSIGILMAHAVGLFPTVPFSPQIAGKRLRAQMDAILDESCSNLLHGSDHEIRKYVAKPLIDCARYERAGLDELNVVARRAFLEWSTRKSA